MPYSDIYLYSPLTVQSVKEGFNRAILLEFILCELISAMESDKKEDPLDFLFASRAPGWSIQVGCLNKIGDHAKLLPYAFPSFKKSIKVFEKVRNRVFNSVYANIPKEELMEGLREIYHALIPFLIDCKECEDLLLFLLKNSSEIGTLSYPATLKALLGKMFPEGLDKIDHLIRRGCLQNGNSHLLKEMDRIQLFYEQ